jgi:recombination protein RecR
VPQGELDSFASSIQNLKKGTIICSICFSVDEADPCSICANSSRDKSTICVVEEPLDVLALEKNGRYKGVYHVLHGKIDPLNNIGPDEIYIRQLIDRASGSEIKEIILATNPTMEGEATAMYIAKQIKNENQSAGRRVKITRIGRGLPTGADLEYADELTLQRAMEGRSDY